MILEVCDDCNNNNDVHIVIKGCLLFPIYSNNIFLCITVYYTEHTGVLVYFSSSIVR